MRKEEAEILRAVYDAAVKAVDDPTPDHDVELGLEVRIAKRKLAELQAPPSYRYYPQSSTELYPQEQLEARINEMLDNLPEKGYITTNDVGETFIPRGTDTLTNAPWYRSKIVSRAAIVLKEWERDGKVQRRKVDKKQYGYYR